MSVVFIIILDISQLYTHIHYLHFYSKPLDILNLISNKICELLEVGEHYRSIAYSFVYFWTYYYI